MAELLVKSTYGACSGVTNQMIGKNTNNGPLLLQENDMMGIVGYVLFELSQRNDIKITWLDGDDE